MTSTCVLHICADYPDAFKLNKTPVIARLVDGMSASVRNIVISINRTSDPRTEQWIVDGDLWAVRYFAPPGGVLLSYFLNRLARQIEARLKAENIVPTVSMGHKFTVESYICWRIWQSMGVPYVAAFMGNTDKKIFKAKPHYRSAFHAIVKNAKSVVFPTPWCADYFNRHLLEPAGVSQGGQLIVPYISNVSISGASPVPHNVRRFVTICRLDVWRLKNIHRLIKAIALLRAQGGDWSLDIVGGGSTKAESQVKRLIDANGMIGHVRLLGAKTRKEIDQLLPAYSAMVLPSYPESFGLVYLEALSAGVPVMVAKNAGIDGFFSGRFPGVVATYDSQHEIVQGLTTLAQDNHLYRAKIDALGADLAEFEGKVIVNKYLQLAVA